MISKLEDVHARVSFWVRIVAITVMLTIVSMFSLLVYWATEPDPLTVSYVKGDNAWSTCENRKWTLIRDVQARKDLKVHVKEYWWEMDGMRDIRGKMNEYPHKPVNVYTLTAGTDRIFEFPKTVPSDLAAGRYRYRPHAEYEVNPIKTIRRDLPWQYVQVKCDYDKTKHGVME